MKSAEKDSNEIKKAKQKLGKTIRKLREKQEFSLRELARAVDSIIRGTPPPDVCNIICKNKELNDVLRIIDGQKLNSNQIEQLKLLIKSFRTETEKGEKDNG